jgi:plastocyanin
MQRRYILLSLILGLSGLLGRAEFRAHAAGEPGSEPSPAASLSGTFLTEAGTAPKHAVVYLEGVPAGSFTVPTDKPTISQRGARFRPEFLVVSVGQSVEMPNDDRITHNVFSVSPPKKFDLGHYPQGQTRTVRFEKAGIVELFCNIHENMQATIVVTPSPHYSLVSESGQWSIESVPAGKYRLIAYSAGVGQETVAVELKPGERSAVNVKLQSK